MERLNEIKDNLFFSETELCLIFDVARRCLFQIFGEISNNGSSTLSFASLPRVNVTFRTRGQVRGSMSGRGQSLNDQLSDAVQKAASDVRFSGSLVRSDLDNVTIEIWLQVSSEDIPFPERGRKDIIEIGHHGVEIQAGKSFAYYKPSVPLTSNIDTTHELFSALCKKAGLPESSWMSEDSKLRKTTWIHICEAPARCAVELSGLRPSTRNTFSTEDFVQLLSENARYLRNNQHADGSFTYIYKPLSDSVQKSDLNPVRSSGCTFAIASAASSIYLASESWVKACAIRSIDNVLRRLVWIDQSSAYIADSPDSPGGKLGTSALLLLALLAPASASIYRSEAQALLTGIKSLQSKDGFFRCTYEPQKSRNSHTNFFPGQALLALVLASEAGENSCKEHYQRAFEAYRSYFRKAPASAFVGWQVDVWSRAALLDQKEEYASFAFEQVDWLLQFQISTTTRHLEKGGFSVKGNSPNYSSIVFTEAVARAASLAYAIGDPRWKRYKAAFQIGMQFCLLLSISREQSSFLPNPDRALGGVATSISNFDVRADFVQHMMTLAMAALERPIILNE